MGEINVLSEILRSRRSVRRFKDEPLSQGDIEKLKEACLRSPSSRNLNPWDFIFVTKKKILEELSTLKQHGSTFIKNAALAVVVCADADVADTWIEDCSIAAIILQLTAQELGLGSCWVQVRMRNDAAGRSSESIARHATDLPDEKRVLCVIAIGHPDEFPDPIPRAELDWKKIKDVF